MVVVWKCLLLQYMSDNDDSAFPRRVFSIPTPMLQKLNYLHVWCQRGSCFRHSAAFYLPGRCLGLEPQDEGNITTTVQVEGCYWVTEKQNKLIWVRTGIFLWSAASPLASAFCILSEVKHNGFTAATAGYPLQWVSMASASMFHRYSRLIYPAIKQRRSSSTAALSPACVGISLCTFSTHG